MDFSCPSLVYNVHQVFSTDTLMALDYTYAGSFRFESSDDEDGTGSSSPHGSEEEEESEAPSVGPLDLTVAEEEEEEEEVEEEEVNSDDEWLGVYHSVRDVQDAGEIAMFYVTGGGGPTVGYCCDLINGVRRFLTAGAFSEVVFVNVPAYMVVIQRWDWRSTPALQVREVNAADERWDIF
jgi:hypothetical protein